MEISFESDQKSSNELKLYVCEIVDVYEIALLIWQLIA